MHTLLIGSPNYHSLSVKLGVGLIDEDLINRPGGLIVEVGLLSREYDTCWSYKGIDGT